jgi:CRISPR/Cas system-associated exonuclease Cas4 (RecB family)
MFSILSGRRWKMPKVLPDGKFQELVITSLREREKELSKYHDITPDKIRVHALVYCLKKSYWDIVIDRTNLPRSDRSIGYYVGGRGHHQILECIRGYLKEQEVIRWGIYGRLDMFGDFPVEIKTTRAPPSLGIPKHWLKQLGFYCLLTGKKAGKLIVFFINVPEIRVFHVEFDDDELEAWKLELIDRAERLREALKTGNIEVLEGTNYDWECSECEYQFMCKK